MALHESRRRQAARAILQHRHLIHQEHEAEAAKTTGTPSPREQFPQIVRETEKPTANPGAMMSIHSKRIIAIVVTGFAVLHFIGNGALLHASATQPTEDRMPFGRPRLARLTANPVSTRAVDAPSEGSMP